MNSGRASRRADKKKRVSVSLEVKNAAYSRLESRLIPIADRFQENMWAGKRAFIVGGGKGLKGFPFEKLKGEHVIAVNRAHECGVAEIIVSGDRMWVSISAPEEGVTGEIPVVYAQRPDVKCKKKERRFVYDKFPVHVVNCCVSPRLWGTTFAEGVSQGCSGIRAANLACILGASPVYLLGIDMFGSNHPHKWWHEGYNGRLTSSREKHYNEFLAHWVKAMRYAQRAGINPPLVNLSPSSRLQCLPYQDWRTVLS